MGNVLTYPVTGLTPGVTYHFRLRGVNGNGQSGNSNTIAVGTLPLPPAPEATSATMVTGVYFHANWNPVVFAPPVTNYYLDISSTPDFSVMVPGYENLNVGDVTTFLATGLAPTTTYYYRVRSENSNGISLDSNVVMVMTPLIPTLSEWGLIILGLTLLAFGTFYILKMRG